MQAPLNPVSRLARLADIKGQIGDKRRHGKYGGTPAVVAAYTLDRQFDVSLPDTVRVPLSPDSAA